MLFQYTERMFLAWSSETESHAYVLMTQIANKDWPIPHEWRE